MSVKIMSAVFERYPNGGGEMVLALALADHAHDDGTHVFPSIKTLSVKSRQSERTVQYQLRRMEESGWLLLVAPEFGTRSKAREYRISLEWIKGADFALLQKGCNPEHDGCNPAQKRVQPDAEMGATVAAPKPSVIINEPSYITSLGENGLPDWLDGLLLESFIDFRKGIKSVMTDHAIRLAVGTLSKLRDEGYSPADVINQSILCGYKGLFKISGASSGAKNVKYDPYASGAVAIAGGRNERVVNG